MQPLWDRRPAQGTATIYPEKPGAIRILLTRVAKERALPLELLTTSAEHDAWFKAKVHAALTDSSPPIPNKVVEEHFAKRRSDALKRS